MTPLKATVAAHWRLFVGSMALSGLASACGPSTPASAPSSSSLQLSPPNGQKIRAHSLSGSRAAVALPDTPAAKQLIRWLKAFNTSQRAPLLRLHDESFPYTVASADVADVDRELRLSQGTGGLRAVKIRESAASQIVVVLQERKGPQFAEVTLSVMPNPPHVVRRFDIHPIPPPLEFLPKQVRRAAQLSEVQRHQLFNKLIEEIRRGYVIPEAGEQIIASLRALEREGRFTDIADGPNWARQMTKVLHAVGKDLHLRVVFGRNGPGPEQQSPERRISHLRRMGFGFGPVHHLSGGVAHLVINGFVPSMDEETLDEIGRIMSQVSDAKALIVDLRRNRGGYPPTTTRIASYLFGVEPVHFTTIVHRIGDKRHEMWTHAEVSGKRFGPDKPLYVLTSRQTFSGGEGLAYGLQARGRAVIVGETTAGGAHPTEPRQLSEWYRLVLPIARSENPVTLSNWQGVGVVPDVAAPAVQALKMAHQLALKTLAGQVAPTGPVP